MWQQTFVGTDRGKFEIFTRGDGEPLCLTHLYSEFNELGAYFADEFTNSFKVILVNLRGVGSPCRVEGMDSLSMEQSVYDLEALRKALGYKKWAFAGHSTGGMLGLKYAILAPEFLTKIMVGGAAASNKYMEHPGSMYCPQSPLNKRMKEILTTLRASKDRDERIKVNVEWSNMSLYFPEKRDVYFKKPSSGKVVSERLDYSYNELPNYDLTSDLLNVDVPTFVYCGIHDAQCPYEFSEEIHSLLKNSRFFKYQYSNHFPFIEEKEEFNLMVRKFKDVCANEWLSKG
ncbi:alpha/beta fold hydrolase [Shouchella patagoniensis]|uniref:alpha/beta fold hydrolase n=1 Tax=Shouchella patagoniensis TaxID=228576 RepID=UPI00099508ED|nr:alpha/beta hydrolase [Shouchella patagoniensis]